MSTTTLLLTLSLLLNNFLSSEFLSASKKVVTSLNNYIEQIQPSKRNPQRNIDFASDINFESRFYHLINSSNIALEYFNILINSYATEVFNFCVLTSKQEIKKQILKHKEEFVTGLNSQDQAKASQAKVDKYRLFEQFLESKKEAHTMDQLVGICEQFYNYVTTHFFMSKMYLDLGFALFLFKDQFLNEDEHFLDRYTNREYRKWFEMMEEREQDLNNLSHLHQEMFYLVVNKFVDNQMNLKKIVTSE